MEVTHETVDDVNVIHMKGKLTINNAQGFFSQTESLLNSGEKKLLLNMSDLNFIDSTGLGTIIRLSKRINEDHCRLRLSNLQPKIMKIVELTRLDNILSIYNNQEEALKDY